MEKKKLLICIFLVFLFGAFYVLLSFDDKTTNIEYKVINNNTEINSNNK